MEMAKCFKDKDWGLQWKNPYQAASLDIVGNSGCSKKKRITVVFCLEEFVAIGRQSWMPQAGSNGGEYLDTIHS